MVGSTPASSSARARGALFSALEAQALAIGEQDARRRRPAWPHARAAWLPLTNPRLEALRLLVILAQTGRIPDIAAQVDRGRAAGLADRQLMAVIVTYGPAELRRAVFDTVVFSPLGGQ